MLTDGTIGSVFLMAVVGEIGTWGDVGVGGLAVVGVGGPVLLTAPGTDVIATVAPVFFFLRMTPVGRSGKRESMKFVLSCITAGNVIDMHVKPLITCLTLHDILKFIKILTNMRKYG